ncbi:hypothetical protein EVAR_44991_1 [Eumeta japonica]|uniref:Uncharacterized protein n=1 Tax=Eumeta variegata TaxID=151549 RepID=A0A4C1XIC7_EUMVA|nr:hypothetical protein EVAR_44991_1 [Eumeta japonica]
MTTNARDLCIETVEEFIQRIARRMYNIADQGPYEFLRNIVPVHERRRAADPSPENSSKHLLLKSKEQTSLRGGFHKLDFRKGTIIIRTVGVVSPTRRRPGMRQQINPPSRTCDQERRSRMTHEHECNFFL